MLTAQQLTLLKSNATTTGAPGVAPTQAMTPEQAHAWIGGTPSTPSTPIVSNPMTDINKAGADVNDAVTGTGDRAGQGAIERGVGAASSAALAIPNVVADVIPGGKTALNAVGGAFNAATGAAGNIGNLLADISQKIGLMSPEQRAAYDKANADFANSESGKTTTNVADTLNSLGNIANTILGAKGAVSTAEAVPAAVAKVKGAITPEPPPPGAAEVKVKAQTATKIKGVADTWAKPTTINSTAYNGARAVLAKDPTIPKFLAEQGVNPWAHIENERYATADTAQALRDTAGKMSNDTLRPSLQMADYSTPKTSVADVVKTAIKENTKDPTQTAGDREAIIRNITKEGAALQRKFPDGMSLTDIHDNKITYSKNAGYSPMKSASDNNLATGNRSISSALQHTLESKAPSGVPVEDFNGYLSQYYKAADYLDALNNKKAPVSLGQNIAHRGAQVLGAVAGHGIGGGILGGVGGYVIGGALEHALEHLSNSARGSFLSNLEVTNPEAFTKVREYLTKQNSGANGMLRLPAAGKDTPIPLGPDSVTPKPTVAPYAAKAKLPVANPKTGRMTRVYTSESAKLPPK